MPHPNRKGPRSGRTERRARDVFDNSNGSQNTELHATAQAWDTPSIFREAFIAKVMGQLPGVPEPRIMVEVLPGRGAPEQYAEAAAEEYQQPVASSRWMDACSPIAFRGGDHDRS
jgi:hypothetical protein